MTFRYIENKKHHQKKPTECGMYSLFMIVNLLREMMKPEDFIERYCSKLNINAELTKLCQFIAIKIEKKNLMPENTPHSIAAGIVYFISQLCKINVSKREVKSISEISEVTINKCYKKLEKLTEELVPQVILNKYAPTPVTNMAIAT